MSRRFLVALLAAAIVATLVRATAEAQPPVVWSELEKPVAEQIRNLRKLPDNKRARVTKQLAIDIRNLPSTPNKLLLASGLANLSTEGDFGRDALEEVAATLAAALREHPVPAETGDPAGPYMTLAQLIRYEHVTASLDDPQLAAAVARLEADDQHRRDADFTLTDLHGTAWKLKQLRGKVVLVNFWATWCAPCRKEMPDLEALYKQFKDEGLVILAISDEDASKVAPFIAGRNITYPVLLDADRKVNQLFRVDGIPKSFVYNREGRLVAQAIDMRTRAQFLAMLALAGLPRTDPPAAGYSHSPQGNTLH